MRLEDLTELQIDALREVGSIGAGHAATALSQLLGRPVGVALPTLEIIPLSDVPSVFGGPEQLTGAVYVRLQGQAEGGMLFMAAREASLTLIDLMHDRPPGTTVSFGHVEEQTITHLASILLSAYLAAIARMTDLEILPSDPHFAFDMAGAILQVATVRVPMSSTSAALARTLLSDEETSVEAGVFFLPEPDGLETILGRLGLV